ncbi:MAG: DNA polymerase III subunit alpha [Planctomycetes bacterium]|nr:DNA polymerase III subunit alpha [Planctomycetota bacterium]
MSSPGFVHLHVHTHYSLLDGLTRIEALVQRAKEFQMPAVAMTDHGNLFGAVEFHVAACKAGVKPIIGLEAYLARGDRRSREGADGKGSFHLLLLAMNLKGYQNLIRLATLAYLEGFYRKPRIDKAILREYSEGLICTSTCLSGEIPRALLNRDRKAADELAATYLDIFGPERFFIELQDHGLEAQRTINPELVDMAKHLGVATIATNDVHYLESDDVEAHDVLCCINTGKLVADEDRFRFETDQFYFKSPSEMAALFSDYPDAIANTLHVADMCNLELDLTQRYSPVYKVPEDITDKSGQPLDDASYLRQLVYQGAKKRYENITPELRKRIDYELDIITRKGFASYFLIVWDCVDYARRKGIPVGARGSGCSAVVAHCLGISAPDPIRYGLYFERFLDPDRDEAPDIDLDICQNGRGQLIDYVRERYGHVAQIITFNKLKAKAVVKDVARVLGMEFADANALTKLIPAQLHITLEIALKQEPELKKRYDSEPQVKRIIDIGRRLEGVARNAGVHAAGIVVADKPLVNFLPLCLTTGQDAIVTQYDGPTVERVGLLKMDFLGLRTLTTLERARQLAEHSTGESIDLEQIDLTDPKVYALFARGQTKGVFQFESGGMRDVVMRMKPNRIEDLIAANALFRPGPMEYIPEYIARKHGAPWTTPHPIMTEVLEETYGIMVYQEQVSRVVNRLGQIPLNAAFRLAKAISKKKTEMIEAMREPFLNGCVKNGVAREVAQQVFEDILKFGGYAFNKAHSTGYALLAYQTAWLKTYHPVEFMAALMTFEMSSTDKVAEYREACRDMGITIEAPAINRSAFDFVVERRAVRPDDSDETQSTKPPGKPGLIRFGLGAIKGVGAKAVGAIVEEREANGPFRDLFDFCERVDLSVVNRGALEALICAGAFDETGAMRRALFEALDRSMAVGQQVQLDRRSGQMGLFGSADADSVASTEPRATALSTEEWTEAEMLAREKAALGFYITRHPLANCEKLIEACATATTVDLARHKDGDQVVLGGMVSALRTVKTRTGRNAGKSMGLVTIEDLQGKIEAVLFSADLVKYGRLLVPDQIVFVEGSVDRQREEPSLRISRVILEQDVVRDLARALVIQVTAHSPVEKLAKLLREHGGPCPVYMSVVTEDGVAAQVACNQSMRVTCEAKLLAGLIDLVGPDAVCVLGPTRRPIPLGSAPASPPPTTQAPTPANRTAEALPCAPQLPFQGS